MVNLLTNILKCESLWVWERVGYGFTLKGREGGVGIQLDNHDSLIFVITY